MQFLLTFKNRSRSLTLEVNSYSQHLAKDLIGWTCIIFFFLLSNIIAEFRQEGALSTNI